MTDIFISYARKDRDRVKILAHALKSHGWSVFWDPTIPPGATWRDTISAAVSAARCVIVIWSEASVQSNWVSEEAEEGRKRQVLVPVRIDKVDPPLGFRHVQAANLVGWSGNESAEAFLQLVAAITEILSRQQNATQTPMASDGGSPVPDEISLAPHPSGLRRRWLTTWLSLAVGGVVLLLAALILWPNSEPPKPKPKPTIIEEEKVLATWKGAPCYYFGTVLSVEGERYEIYYGFGDPAWVERGDVVVTRAPLPSELEIGKTVYARADRLKDMWLPGIILERRDDMYYVQFQNPERCETEQPHVWVESTGLLIDISTL